MTRKHRSQKDIPVGVVECRELLRWLYEHPAWDWPTLHEDVGCPDVCIDIGWAYVNPTTHAVEDDNNLNTHFEVWIEAGPCFDLEEDTARNGLPAPDGGWNWTNKWTSSHDLDLDCGADDLETALLTLATLVDVFYDPATGKNRDNRPVRCEGSFKDGDTCTENWVSGCTDAEDGFCARCGFSVE